MMELNKYTSFLSLLEAEDDAVEKYNDHVRHMEIIQKDMDDRLDTYRKIGPEAESDFLRCAKECKRKILLDALDADKAVQEARADILAYLSDLVGNDNLDPEELADMDFLKYLIENMTSDEEKSDDSGEKLVLHFHRTGTVNLADVIRNAKKTAESLESAIEETVDRPKKGATIEKVKKGDNG